MLMERGQNEQQHKQRFAFLEEKPCLFYLSQNTIRGIYMVVMYTWLELIKDMTTSVYIQVIYRVG